MKAAILHSADSVPVYGDFAEPAAGPGSQVVDLVAAGIHHRHPVGGGRPALRQRRGLPASSPASTRWPAPTVASWSSPPPPRRRTAPSPSASPRPTRCGSRCRTAPQPEAVAAGVNPGMASWLPLQARQAEAGKLATVLILGVTGMSGFLAAQNARLLGAARVVGAGRSRPGLDRAAAAGAETVALTGDRDADAEALAAVLGGDAPGLVLDFVWGSGRRDRLRGPRPPGPPRGHRRHHVRPDRRAGRSRGRRTLLAAAQPEADHLGQRGRLGSRRRDQGPDPALPPAHRRRLRPGAVPDLPPVRRGRGLDRLRRIRPAGGPGPRLSVSFRS